jgi:hypothetical protein
MMSAIRVIHRRRSTVLALAAVLTSFTVVAGTAATGADADAAAPPSAPHLQLVVPGDATVRMTWGVPATGAPVQGYRVQRRVQSKPAGTWSAWSTRTVAASVRSFVWRGLPNGYRYQVRVAAQNVNGVGAFSAVRAATPQASLIDRGIRAQVTTAYRKRFASTLRVANRWTGSVSGCRAGTNSAAYRGATKRAVNYMRSMAGVGPIDFAKKYNGLAQKSALMMQANNQLNHFPPKSWKCYSAAGAQAAGHSDIALGAAGPVAIGLYMSDPGDNNFAAGHRRWIIYPRQKVMGTGDTSLANDLWVLGPFRPTRPKGTPTWQAWPNSGFFPRELEPGGRWSLTATDGSSFARARVAVIGPGGTRMALTKYPDAPGYGDNTLVWQLKRPPSSSASGVRRYTVRVTGITTSGGGTTSHVYRVALYSAN